MFKKLDKTNGMNWKLNTSLVCLIWPLISLFELVSIAAGSTSS